MIDKLLNCVKKKETDKEIKAFKVLCPLIEKYISSLDENAIKSARDPEDMLRYLLISGIERESVSEIEKKYHNYKTRLIKIKYKNEQLLDENYMLKCTNRELKENNDDDNIKKLKKENKKLLDKIHVLKHQIKVLECNISCQYDNEERIEALEKENKKLTNANQRLRNGINKRKLKDKRKTEQIKNLEKKVKEYKNEN